MKIHPAQKGIRQKIFNKTENHQQSEAAIGSNVPQIDKKWRHTTDPQTMMSSPLFEKVELEFTRTPTPIEACER